MIKVKLQGFDKIQRKLNQLAENARQLHGPHEVSFRDLFSPTFMQANTQYGSFSELLEASPFPVETKEDFAKIPDEEWDAYIRQSTRFSSWKEMQSAAAKEYARERLLRGVK